MATSIGFVKNDSDAPAAYVWKGGFGVVPTGWSAWAFPAHSTNYFGRITITTEQFENAVLTKAGSFYIWDDGEWNILMQAGDEQTVLVKLRNDGSMQITLTVQPSGRPSAGQVLHYIR